MPDRLKLPRIEQKPKDVEVVDNFQFFVDKGRRGELEQKLLEIRKCIMQGKPLPAGSYRSGVDTSDDAMLRNYGIMHLHLGHAGTKELLYLVQYPDRVVFLEVNNHYHFTTTPTGVQLDKLYRERLRKSSDARQKLRSERRDAIKRGILAKRRDPDE